MNSYVSLSDLKSILDDVSKPSYAVTNAEARHSAVASALDGRCVLLGGHSLGNDFDRLAKKLGFDLPGIFRNYAGYFDTQQIILDIDPKAERYPIGLASMIQVYDCLPPGTKMHDMTKRDGVTKIIKASKTGKNPRPKLTAPGQHCAVNDSLYTIKVLLKLTLDTALYEEDEGLTLSGAWHSATDPAAANPSPSFRNYEDISDDDDDDSGSEIDDGNDWKHATTNRLSARQVAQRDAERRQALLLPQIRAVVDEADDRAVEQGHEWSYKPKGSQRTSSDRRRGNTTLPKLLVCFDTESKVHIDDSKCPVTEIGITLLDLVKVKDITPGEGFNNWYPFMKSKQFFIKGHERWRTNKNFWASPAEKYYPALSECCITTPEDLKSKITQFIDDYLTSETMEARHSAVDPTVVGDFVEVTDDTPEKHAVVSYEPPSKPTIDDEIFWSGSLYASLLCLVCPDELKGVPCRSMDRCKPQGRIHLCKAYWKGGGCDARLDQHFQHDGRFHLKVTCKSERNYRKGKKSEGCQNDGCKFGHDFMAKRMEFEDRDTKMKAQLAQELLARSRVDGKAAAKSRRKRKNRRDRGEPSQAIRQKRREGNK